MDFFRPKVEKTDAMDEVVLVLVLVLVLVREPVLRAGAKLLVDHGRISDLGTMVLLVLNMSINSKNYIAIISLVSTNS